jgi:ATP-dependent Clp protease ATP-binding subunit ClpX
MYELPSVDNVEKVIVDKDVILGNNEPTLIYKTERKTKKAAAEN